MVLSIERLNKSFGANMVLQDIMAKIEDHDRIGLIGVNGAGKSTLLNLIVGDLQPDTVSFLLPMALASAFCVKIAGCPVKTRFGKRCEMFFSPYWKWSNGCGGWNRKWPA